MASNGLVNTCSVRRSFVRFSINTLAGQGKEDSAFPDTGEQCLMSKVQRNIATKLYLCFRVNHMANFPFLSYNMSEKVLFPVFYDNLCFLRTRQTQTNQIQLLEMYTQFMHFFNQVSTKTTCSTYIIQQYVKRNTKHYAGKRKALRPC